MNKMEDWQQDWANLEASFNFESKAEELLLTWDNHRKNASEAFSSLRNDEFFSDVTLACQDQQFKAHKVVLAACSPFFEQVLKNHQHPNPLIFLKGVEVKHMEALLDFVYCGEVSLEQLEVEGFLRAGEEWGVKGLTVMVTPDSSAPPPPFVRKNKPQLDNYPQVTEDQGSQQLLLAASMDSPTLARSSPAPGTPFVLAEDSPLENIFCPGQDMNENSPLVGSGNVTEVKSELQGVEKWEDLENYAIVLHAKTGGHCRIGCSICGKVMDGKKGKKAMLGLMIAHIEAKHFRQAFSHHCATCEGTFKTRAILKSHIKKNHADEQNAADRNA